MGGRARDERHRPAPGAGVGRECGVQVAGLARDGQSPRWLASTATAQTLGPFDAVIVTTPASQALPLVSASPLLTRAVAAVRMHPCWAALVAFEEPVSTPFDAAYVTSSPLGWIARDRSKPHRGLAETWVLHASAAWRARTWTTRRIRWARFC